MNNMDMNNMDKIINNKYKILVKIGEGSFGTIYKGQNIRTNELVAIKVEPIMNNTKLLKNESIIYTYLEGISNIPSVKWFGKDTINYYMVINLLEESLQFVKNTGYVFSLKLILQIGIKLIFLIKSIHDCGLIHRDIKPDNVLFGHHKKSIYIIDFGFCKPFIKDGVHIPIKNTHNLIGSPLFASSNATKCIELSRRDDLESLGNTLNYLYSNSINNHSLVVYMTHIKSLEFEETPNYSLYANLFMREIEVLDKNI
jgi:serine/threonine protein kinase